MPVPQLLLVVSLVVHSDARTMSAWPVQHLILLLQPRVLLERRSALPLQCFLLLPQVPQRPVE